MRNPTKFEIAMDLLYGNCYRFVAEKWVYQYNSQFKKYYLYFVTYFLSRITNKQCNHQYGFFYVNL